MAKALLYAAWACRHQPVLPRQAVVK